MKRTCYKGIFLSYQYLCNSNTIAFCVGQYAHSESTVNICAQKTFMLDNIGQYSRMCVVILFELIICRITLEHLMIINKSMFEQGNHYLSKIHMIFYQHLCKMYEVKYGLRGLYDNFVDFAYSKSNR